MNDDQLRPDRTDSDAAAERTRALPAPDTTPTTVLPGTDDVRTASAGTGTALLTDERIAPYLAAAEATLADLPPGERSELLEDLAAHLEEISAEEGAALSTRLGPPAEYAAELRASAGYPPAGRPHDRPGVIDRTSALVRTTWQGLTEWIRQVPGGTAALAVLTRLRPAWWVLRGWIAAYLIAGDRLLHSLGFGGLQPFLALVACLALSVAWGLRAERRGRALPIVERIVLLGLNAVAILMCLGGITGSGSLAYLGSSATSDYAPFAEPTGLTMDGSPITNLTAYDLDGNPIDGFQLFDQNGYRVVVDTTQMSGPNGEWVFPLTGTDATGHPVSGTYPITYVMVTDYVDETTGEASVQVSRILTPATGVVPSGLTGPVAPPIGSIVPLDQEEGVPIWEDAVPPTTGEAPTPTPSTTDGATDATDETSAAKAAADKPDASDDASPSPSAKAKSTPKD